VALYVELMISSGTIALIHLSATAFTFGERSPKYMICMLNSSPIQWVNKMKYLGVNYKNESCKYISAQQLINFMVVLRIFYLHWVTKDTKYLFFTCLTVSLCLCKLGLHLIDIDSMLLGITF
jgi:hypothetical protein